jgi:L-alanine-DL-glutamate epimerase-like enolase superfamily enzyme
MKLRVLEVGVFLRRVRTRLPFRYGKAEVLGQPYVHLRVRVEPAAVGVSAAALPPLWFDKRPGRTHEDDIRDLLRSVDLARAVYPAAGRDTAFGLHARSERETRARAHGEGLNDLCAGFGVALLDAAIVDAACRLAGRPFHAGLRDGLFGTPPGWARHVPERPLDRIEVRHTVGLSDPVVPADPGPDPADGLPRSLDQVVRATGVRWFKIKIGGDADASIERLRRIDAVLPPGARLTLDGNEQFKDMEGALEFGRRLAATPDLKGLFERSAWIEQPVERSAALEDAVAGPLAELSRLKPVIIDESDGSDDAVDRALALGYAGVSAKNCKGLWRTLHSHVRAREAGALLSSEDLMNIPVAPLHQDLCVAAALGIPHSERNGHHYIRAFDFLSPRERRETLEDYPSLYRAEPAGVRIEGGAMDLRELNAFGFGVKREPDWDFLEPYGS